MTKKNKYFIRSRISETKLREIINLFVADITAQQIALFSNISRKSINKILKHIRIRIAEYWEKESCFGARRIRGQRGREAKGKTIVFGLKKSPNLDWPTFLATSMHQIISPTQKIPFIFPILGFWILTTFVSVRWDRSFFFKSDIPFSLYICRNKRAR